MELYGRIYSPYMARVVIAARHKKIKHKIVEPEGGNKSPAFLKMNPLGKMPVMKDGKTILFESAVILEYVDAKFKKNRLVPAAAKAGAQVRLISAMFAEYVQPAIFALFGQRDPAKRDMAVVEAKKAELDRMLDVVEGLLLAKPYAAGSKLSHADCYAVPALLFLHVIARILGFEKPLGDRKKLSRYMAKVRKDKLLNGVFTEMEQGLKAAIPGL